MMKDKYGISIELDSVVIIHSKSKGVNSMEASGLEPGDLGVVFDLGYGTSWDGIRVEHRKGNSGAPIKNKGQWDTFAPHDLEVIGTL